MSSGSQVKCISCSLLHPGRMWDDHELCPKCWHVPEGILVWCVSSFRLISGKSSLLGQISKLVGKLDQLPNPNGPPPPP